MVYLNGEFIPMDQARVSPMDRGFLFGDGIYEVIPVYQRKLFEWPAHLARLKHSLSACRIPNPLDDQAWLTLLTELVAHHPWNDQFIYLQITRGLQQPRDHLPAKNLIPTVFVYTNPLKPLSDTLLSQGIKVVSLPDTRWQRCDIKAITLLANVMAKLEAEAAGVDDAILIRPDGFVSEGTASNLVMVKNGQLITPPLSAHILPGITRQVIEKLAHQHQIEFIERDIHQTELEHADELWLASSTKEALPICQLNHQPVGQGQPGNLWLSMREFYQAYKQSIQ